MMHSNKDILTKFIASIIKVVTGGTSEKYAVMILKKFIKNRKAKYDFLEYIDLSSLDSAGNVKIDDQMNSAEPKEVGKFIDEMINSLFSDLFKQLLSREISAALLIDLKMLGVDLSI